MKLISTAALLTCWLITVLTQAQTLTPKPASELKDLDFLVGVWSVEGEMKPGPMGPAGKLTEKAHYRWMEGNFFLVSDVGFEGVEGKGIEVTYIGYDTELKKYTYNAFSSTGEREYALGTVEGDTWTWLADENIHGQNMKSRYTMKVLSPTSYVIKFEISPDGKTWNAIRDGKAAKK